MARTPADHAHDAVTRCTRDVATMNGSLDTVRQAHDANDPARWHEARSQVERQLAQAERSVEHARARLNDAAPEVRQQLAAAERALADGKAAAAAMHEAPRGWKPVSREAEILAVLDQPLAGSARASFEQKEVALKAAFSQLSVAESRTLIDRLRKGVAGDPIAAGFARMVPERRGRLVGFLADARRREALHAARSPAVTPTVAPQASDHGPQPLPDLVRRDLETATGRSLDHVRVHADARGHAMARAHRARAVAIGNDIYMDEGQLDPVSDPGRELLAHEVAHVVQAGAHAGASQPAARRDDHTIDVHRGQTGSDRIDAAEVEADAFAAGFRDQGGGARWTPTQRVGAATPMRAPAGSRPPVTTKPDVAWAYLRANEDHFLAAIGKRLAVLRLAAHERLAWTPDALPMRFRAALYESLGGDQLFVRLPELCHPADPWFVIDQHREIVEGTPGVIVDGREPKGPLGWSDLAGTALATEVGARLAESLARMVPRYVVQLDAKHPAPVTLGDLVTSHPMDRVTARLLCDDQVVRPVAARRGHKPRTSGDVGSFRDGVRFLKDYRWLGSTDPALWNWIEAKDPRDATAEELAATLWLDTDASHRAYAITASPPFFRVDPSWARKFDDAKQHAPAGVDQPHQAHGLALAGSALATDAAIAQAAGERRFDQRGVPLPANLVDLSKVLDQSQRQLERVKAQLAPWKLWELVLPALNWVASHREHLRSIPDHRLIGLAPVIDGQQAILFEAVGAISELVGAAGAAIGVDGDDGVMMSVLRHYAIAIGESHLLHTARAELARAKSARGEVSLALLERSARDTQLAVGELRGNETLMRWGGDDAAGEVASARHRILELRGKQATGREIDPDTVDLVAAELKERAVDARARSWYLNLHNLSEEARAAGFGLFETAGSIAGTIGRRLPSAEEIEKAHKSGQTLADAFGTSFSGLPAVIGALITELDDAVIKPHATHKAELLRQAGSNEPKARAWALREAARVTEQRLAAFVRDHKLAEKLGPWIAQIDQQRTRTTVIQIATNMAVLIGISIVGGMVGNVVAGAVRGALLADAAEATVGMLWATRVANATGAVAGLATDAAINATGQILASGGQFGDSFLDNFLASGAVRVALAPLHKVAAAYGAVEHDLANVGLWERSLLTGKTVLRAGAVLTAETITGAGVAYVVHRMRHGGKPDERTALEWALEGGSMAVGKFVGQWLHGFESRLVHLVEHGAHLRRRAARMRKLAERAEQTPDKDASMELLVERHQALDEEARTIHELVAKGKLAPNTADTLERGNRAEQHAVDDASFATMPLRLAGLTPDDASGKVWAGATEDIAIALHQAHRAGLAVEVLEHDAAARQWKVRYNGDELTIVESALSGRPRGAKSEAADADRRHALRYAASAEFLQQRWEARTKAELDGRAVIEFDHVQLGYAFGGVVNQATLPATGEALGSKLVVYDHKGTLSSRGAQELGQGPDKFDAPGVRATEQARKGTAWVTSAQLDRALDVGRLETQTPAYQGTAVELQVRPRGPLPTDWPPQVARQFRLKIRDAAGTARWFYCDRFDNLGGLGPASLKDVTKVVEPSQLDAMLANHQLLRGDDPAYASKVNAGRVLVWGGTPTGAWAAEPAVHAPRSQVTVLGDTRPPSDWPALIREYEDLAHQIATHASDHVPAELVARKAEIAELIAKAHGGMALRRNTKPGATYDQPVTHRGPRDVQIEFGTPSRIAPTTDGRVIVTVGTGDHARSSVYDQVVIAHGQDPGAPGAPGALLGRGATTADGDVLAGTIALRPIYGPARPGREPEIFGLESIDPPGIQHKGAAFASKRMSPWVAKGERARFERAVDGMASEHVPTRDHGPVSGDSRGVSAGVEVQRDRIPRANEVLGAKAYRLPGPDHTLALDPAHRDRWDDQVREFFTLNLRASARWVRVEQLGGGKSGAIVYRVWVDDNDVGVFKLFDRQGAANEQKMLALLERARLTRMTPVRERGTIAIDPRTGFDGALLMDAAKGTSVKQLIEAMPAAPSQRDTAMSKLRAAVERVAEGLAEMHMSFESASSRGGSRLMTREAKLDDANYFLNKSFGTGEDVAKVQAALGERDFQRVKAALEGPVLDAFLAADVPATAYHGDANAGNFIVEDYRSGTGYKDLGVIDVGSMKYSIDGASKGTKTGAADVARFLGSLETLDPGKLAPADIQKLRDAFMKMYLRRYAEQQHHLDQAGLDRAARWYQVELEVAVLKTDPRAKARILQLLGLEAAP